MEKHHDTDLAGRYDIYGPIHKGLRLGLARLLTRLGATDFADPATVTALLGDLRAHLALGRAHLTHEEEHIHRALDTRAAGACARLEEQHGHHKLRFAELDGLIRVVEASAMAERAAAGHDLYLAFSAFVAEDLAHMHEEETATRAQLCAAFTDAELQGIEFGIISSLTPDENIAYMRLMLPAMTPVERLGLLSGMKAGAPAEAFAAVIELAAKPTLPANDFANLAAGLGIAA
ncbi:MAG: hypothetical protein PHS60_14810 [Zavarzinia sp.]|nr:hypothetical protein [Zavarzinia sp.]